MEQHPRELLSSGRGSRVSKWQVMMELGQAGPRQCPGSAQLNGRASEVEGMWGRGKVFLLGRFSGEQKGLKFSQRLLFTSLKGFLANMVSWISVRELASSESYPLSSEVQIGDLGACLL